MISISVLRCTPGLTTPTTLRQKAAFQISSRLAIVGAIAPGRRLMRRTARSPFIDASFQRFISISAALTLLMSD